MMHLPKTPLSFLRLCGASLPPRRRTPLAKARPALPLLTVAWSSFLPSLPPSFSSFSAHVLPSFLRPLPLVWLRARRSGFLSSAGEPLPRWSPLYRVALPAVEVKASLKLYKSRETLLSRALLYEIIYLGSHEELYNGVANPRRRSLSPPPG